MKKLLIILLISAFSLNAPAQAKELAQLALNIEKLAQFKQILSDLKKAYQILFTGYNTIKNISEGNFKLHQQFLNSLLAVNPSVAKYKRVADIINYQIQLVKEYKSAYNRFRQDKNLTPKEIAYIAGVYSRLFDQSLKNLDALANVVTANKLRMSDDERLTAIDRLYEDMRSQLGFLRQFNNSTTLLALQRAKAKNDVQTMQNIYGLTK